MFVSGSATASGRRGLFIGITLGTCVTLGVVFGPTLAQRLLNSSALPDHSRDFSTPKIDWVSGNRGSGAVARVETIAQRAASSGEAIAATMFLFSFGDALCADGRSFTVMPVEPAPTVAAADHKHPAGTRFVNEFQCEGDLPNEFALEPGTSDEAARSAVEEKLGSTAHVNAHGSVTRMNYNDKHPKYKAFKEYLGSVTSSAMHSCGDSVVVHRVVVGAYPNPAPEQNVHLSRSEMWVGSDIRCADAISAPEALAATKP